MAATIQKIVAYEILDSRGIPTVEARLILNDGREVSTSIPSGTSVGKYEAVEIRDNDPKRFNGLGVVQATGYINNLIAPKLVGVSPLKQYDIDHWLINADGTKNKSVLGVNVTLAISQLFIKAGALVQNIPLFFYINKYYESVYKEFIKIEKIPTPIFNVINGGKHANNNLKYQEFQIIPSSSLKFDQALQMGAEFFHELKSVLLYRNANISVGEEGGYAPNFSNDMDGFEILTETAARRELKLGLDLFLGVDFASSYYTKNGKYEISDKAHPMKKEEYVEYINNLAKSYAFLCLEDPIDEDDFGSWTKLNDILPKNIYLIGDDLLASNKTRLEKAIKEASCTTVLIKPNQVGTITEVLEVVQLARKNNINYVVSHRSGETNDDFIADFGVGIQADFVKFGAPSRGERVTKYNRLWKIVREDLKL